MNAGIVVGLASAHMEEKKADARIAVAVRFVSTVDEEANVRTVRMPGRDEFP